MSDDRETVDSAGDERTTNNTMRHQYKVLTEGEKAQMIAVKDMGLAFHDLVSEMGPSRDVSLAKTHIEDAVMRAVRHITG